MLCKKYWIFVVDDYTWPEHQKASIAAINKPPTEAGRQSAIAEIIGVRPGDYIFFNIRVSEDHPPQIIGLYEATTEPYYDPAPLFDGAKYIGENLPYNLPYRVAFKQVINFPEPIDVDEIWRLKDRGLIWSIQQSRGDAVGVHACTCITKFEGELILKLLEANNPVKGTLKTSPPPPPLSQRQPLPINLSTDPKGNLHYEHALKALILKGLAHGKFKEILGDYDDYVPNMPTGARKEIDILLLKYSETNVIWYQILELKKDSFSMKEMERLIEYENWFRQTRALSPIQVHPVAIAYDFENVKNYVKRRTDYNKRRIRLLRYQYDSAYNEITFFDETP
jgi:hypothetical protein